MRGSMWGFRSPERRLIDQFSRRLDRIEKTAPMKGGYARINPYAVNQHQGGRDYRLLIFHAESKAWFDKDAVNSSLCHMERCGLVRSGDVVFDLGCNVGFNAMWYALAAGPTGRVVAFDPFPWNALTCEFNARLNELDNVEVHQIGIGATEEFAEISLADARTAVRTGPRLLKTQLLPLQRFADRRPTVMKMDVEGAEYEISETDFAVFDRLRLCFMEFHPQYIRERGLAPEKCLANFSARGFTLRQHEPDGRIHVPGAPFGSDGFWMFRVATGSTGAGHAEFLS